ncbi:MAG: glycosyltransferase family 4 protein [Planctomycetota bacterium]|jgi:glycosyltransferase involved in cell wall biosynthesis|nr:glycosyltransferase family 4 protein [Planctomycetota bacterium]
MKRILQILPDFGLSGAAFATLNLLPDLVAAGCEIMVVAPRGGERVGMFRQIDARKISEYVLPGLGGWFDWRGRKLTRAFKPEIVNTTCVEVAALGVPVAKRCGAPLALTVNRTDGEKYLRKLPLNQVNWGVVALSDAIRTPLILHLRLPEERIFIVPNGLDLRQFPASPSRLLVNADQKTRTLVVGTYGTLAENKGQRDFLKAAALVIAQGFDVEFLIMGEGADKQYLRDEAGGLGIDNRLTFSFSTMGGSHNLMNIDVFVEPTHREGFGLSVLQAMASGVPVVASGVGGIFDLVKDGETGLLVKSQDAKAMSEAISDLLKNPPKRAALAYNARSRVEKEFSSRVVSAKLLECFGKIASGKFG